MCDLEGENGARSVLCNKNTILVFNLVRGEERPLRRSFEEGVEGGNRFNSEPS